MSSTKRNASLTTAARDSRAENPSSSPTGRFGVLRLAAGLCLLVSTLQGRAQCLGSSSTPTSFEASFVFDECRTNVYPILYVSKGEYYQQTSATASNRLSSAYGLTVYRGRPPQGDSLGQVQSAFVRTPICAAGNIWLNTPLVTIPLSSRQELDSAVPAGTYTLGLTVGGVNTTTTYTMPANPWPRIPMLENHAEAQDIDPDKPFVVRIAADATTARTSISYQPLYGVPEYARDCSATSSNVWTIPAGSLRPNSVYLLHMTSQRIVGSSDLPGAPGTILLCGISTSVQIKTKGQSIPFAITAQPQPQTVTAGSPATFSVGISGGPALSYVWYKDNAALAGQNQSTLRIPAASAADAGSYSVLVIGLGTTLKSSPAQLTVLPSVTILTQPVDKVAAVGGTATLSVVAQGAGTLKYQWYKNGAAIRSGTSATLTLKNLTSANTGLYKVRVSNASGSVTSREAALNVLTPPTITTQPVGKTVTVRTKVTFTVKASGSGPFTYQWYKDGKPLTANATSATFTIASAALADAGKYAVKVSNAVGSITSSVATLVVKR